jgi:hypothetical protein
MYGATRIVATRLEKSSRTSTRSPQISLCPNTASGSFAIQCIAWATTTAKCSFRWSSTPRHSSTDPSSFVYGTVTKWVSES